MTPQEAHRYLHGRRRDACDRAGSRSRLAWGGKDIEAVGALLDHTQRHSRRNALPVYEKLTREVALRDGLL